MIPPTKKDAEDFFGRHPMGDKDFSTIVAITNPEMHFYQTLRESYPAKVALAICRKLEAPSYEPLLAAVEARPPVGARSLSTSAEIQYTLLSKGKFPSRTTASLRLQPHDLPSREDARVFAREQLQRFKQCDEPLPRWLLDSTNDIDVLL